GARTKNGCPHQVPLSGLAMSIIGEAMADIGPDAQFLFPNDDGEGTLPAHAIAKTITRGQERFGIPHWTAHDLRRTAISEMEQLGVAPIVLGHIANHRTTTRAGVTLLHYGRYEYGKEK